MNNNYNSSNEIKVTKKNYGKICPVCHCMSNGHFDKQTQDMQGMQFPNPTFGLFRGYFPKILNFFFL